MTHRPGSLIRSFLVIISLGALAACQTPPPAPSPPPVRIESLPQVFEPGPSEPVTPEDTPPAEGEPAFVYEDLWERLRAGFRLGQHQDNPAVQRQLQIYRNDQRYFDLVSERAAPFLYWIVGQVEQRGLPSELALLPIVESTFDPNAYSAEHAVGLWQFIGPTARSFGLQQDWWYDGRRDPRASTIAALDYLEVLYGQFDENWLLALAAYNTGDGNVRRAIRRSGQRPENIDFWSLPLAFETRSHVPKLLALAALIDDSERYGIELPPIANRDPLALVEVGAQIDLARAAQLAGLDYLQLRALNPGYLQWATHPDRPQALLVPTRQLARLQTGLAQLDPADRVNWDHYEIAPGDTLGGIARRFGTRVDVLSTVNGLSGTRIIAGDSLMIPRGNDLASLPVLSQRLVTPQAPVAVPAFYTVRRGDNLWRIARRFQLRSRDIALWNGMELNSLLRPGQVLDLQFATGADNNDSDMAQAQAGFYLVRAGDSIARIASNVEASVQDLLLWNGLSINELIFPGQQIRITPPVAEAE